MNVGDAVRVIPGTACDSWNREYHARHEGKVGVVDRIWAMDGTDPPWLDFSGMETHRYFVEFPDRNASSYAFEELERVT